MRHIVAAIVALLMMSVTLSAYTYIGGIYGLTIDNTAGGVGLTASAINEGNNHPQATQAVCTLSTAAVRFTVDGTAPTTTVGMPWAVGQTLQFTGHDTLTNFRAIRTGSTSGELNCTVTAP